MGNTVQVPHVERKHALRLNGREVLRWIATSGKFAWWILVFVFVAWHWSYFSMWLSTVTHIEIPYFKADRYVEASQKAEAYSKTKEANDTGFDLTYAKAAIIRAERASPAIKGARVLWVDQHPENNKTEMDILGDLGVRFVTVLSTKEAMDLLSRDRFDLVISNVGRDDPPTSLSKCQVHYFKWPSGVSDTSFGGDLAAYNTQVNARPPGGFMLMEQMKDRFGEAAPPIIFFTASNGGTVTSLCSNTITNRIDELLQSVVSKLEEQRWAELDRDLSQYR